MVPAFDLAALRAIADVLGATEAGFTGSEIGALLAECGIPDPLGGGTKRHRLYQALVEKQDRDRAGNHIVAFIQHAMNPVRHHDRIDWFAETRQQLNVILAFAGLSLGQDGQVRAVQRASTHTEARARAASLRDKLVAREVHGDVLRFCREELLADNYFHAVFEATKSVADKIRRRSGVDADGADLVDRAFGLGNGIPHLAINSLTTQNEQGEQRGFMNLLKGLFGTFRNTTAHAPRITWTVTERDALDILSLVSLLHRRLDDAVEARAISEGRPVRPA